MANLLIVDDSSFVRVVLRKYLEKIGHIIVGEAACEEEAFKLYKELLPDIVTLDIVLEKDGNGINLLKKILNFDPKANVIMCSSNCYQSLVIQAVVELGAKGFITKPIQGKALRDNIDKILKGL